MNGLDLFSGIGGMSIALRGYVKPLLYCESDRYAQGVLLSRMADRSIQTAPIWDDVTTLGADQISGKIDIIYGGFPCQDISSAGRGEGLEGKRSSLFYEFVRLAKETYAPFIFLENVPAIRTRGLRQVVGALTEVGYDCRWTCLSASILGAPHKRERWFLLAHANSTDLWIKYGGSGWPERKIEIKSLFYGEQEPMANTSSEGLQDRTKVEVGRSEEIAQSERQGWWTVEPDVGRVANGIPKRVDRLKCLGNAVVPSQARAAFERLAGLN